MTTFEEFIQSNPNNDEDKVIKELVDIKTNLIAKSELSFEQVVEICKLKHIARKYRLTNLDLFITDFLEGMISKNREGRKEFIRAIEGQRSNKENLGMFSNLKDKLR